MGFDDLEDAAAEQDADKATDTDSRPGEEPTQTSRRAAPQATDNDADDWKRRPGFPYDEAVQKPLYPRRGVWDDFEAFLNYEVERELVTDRGHDDVQGRELHDAVLRVVMEHADEVIEAFEDARR